MNGGFHLSWQVICLDKSGNLKVEAIPWERRTPTAARHGEFGVVQGV